MIQGDKSHSQKKDKGRKKRHRQKKDIGGQKMDKNTIFRRQKNSIRIQKSQKDMERQTRERHKMEENNIDKRQTK